MEQNQMNPETGKIERVMGTTADGLDVFESHNLRLKFTLLCWEANPVERSALQFWIEFQTNENGCKMPSMGLVIGRVLFQSGWLFA
jgi:hypothetical protein